MTASWIWPLSNTGKLHVPENASAAQHWPGEGWHLYIIGRRSSWHSPWFPQDELPEQARLQRAPAMHERHRGHVYLLEDKPRRPIRGVSSSTMGILYFWNTCAEIKRQKLPLFIVITKPGRHHWVSFVQNANWDIIDTLSHGEINKILEKNLPDCLVRQALSGQNLPIKRGPHIVSSNLRNDL